MPGETALPPNLLTTLSANLYATSHVGGGVIVGSVRARALIKARWASVASRMNRFQSGRWNFPPSPPSTSSTKHASTSHSGRSLFEIAAQTATGFMSVSHASRQSSRLLSCRWFNCCDTFAGSVALLRVRLLHPDARFPGVRARLIAAPASRRPRPCAPVPNGCIARSSRSHCGRAARERRSNRRRPARVLRRTNAVDRGT